MSPRWKLWEKKATDGIAWMQIDQSIDGPGPGVQRLNPTSILKQDQGTWLVPCLPAGNSGRESQLVS